MGRERNAGGSVGVVCSPLRYPYGSLQAPRPSKVEFHDFRFLNMFYHSRLSEMLPLK